MHPSIISSLSAIRAWPGRARAIDHHQPRPAWGHACIHPASIGVRQQRGALRSSRLTIHDRSATVCYKKSHRGPCADRRQPGEHWMNGPDARQVSSRPCPGPGALPAGRGRLQEHKCTTGCRRQVLVESSPCSRLLVFVSAQIHSAHIWRP
jgi:hypothetical protein